MPLSRKVRGWDLRRTRVEEKSTLSGCMRVCGYFCDLSVEAAFCPLRSVACVLRLSSATLRRRRLLASSFSCMCFCGYLLEPLCHLLALLCSVVCVFAAISCKPLCRRRLFALLCSCVCIVVATSATSVLPPLSRPSLLCCFFLWLLPRPLCRRRLLALLGPIACMFAALSCNLCVVAAFFPLASVACLFTATSATQRSPPPSSSAFCCRRCCSYLLRLVCRRRLPTSSFCCRRFCGYHPRP